MFCRSLFALLSFFIWSLYCLSFDWPILITPLGIFKFLYIPTQSVVIMLKWRVQFSTAVTDMRYNYKCSGCPTCNAGTNHPVVSVWSLTWFIRYIYYWILQFLTNVVLKAIRPSYKARPTLWSSLKLAISSTFRSSQFLTPPLSTHFPVHSHTSVIISFNMVEIPFLPDFNFFRINKNWSSTNISLCFMDDIFLYHSLKIHHVIMTTSFKFHLTRGVFLVVHLEAVTIQHGCISCYVLQMCYKVFTTVQQ